jgi:membrane protein DedA with SNARE-associated domain
MRRLAAWATSVAMVLGGPGLFVVAFIDGSFFSLPEVNDILLVVAVAKHPGLLLYYGAMVTLGSVGGTYVLFRIARTGGEAFLRRRVDERHLRPVRRFFERYGAVAVFVASLLPPPTPFKLFVLVAGVAQMGSMPFLGAVTAGRSLRYFGEGALAYRFGEHAIDYIRENGEMAGMTLAIVTVGGTLAYFLWRVFRERRRRSAES